MKYLKNRKFAVLIVATVIVLSTLFGVHKSLSKEVRRVEAMFYEGVPQKGPSGGIEPKTGAQLEAVQEAILGIWTISGNYPELDAETKQLQSSRNEYMDARSISEKSGAYDKMISAYAAFGKRANMVNISETDKANIEKCDSKIEIAQSLIGKGRYNEEVLRYIDEVASAFPVGILKRLAFVRDPQLF